MVISNLLRGYHSLLTLPRRNPVTKLRVIQAGTICRTIVWPILPIWAGYAYIRGTDNDYFATEALYLQSQLDAPQAFYDSKFHGVRGHWKLQDDMEQIRQVAFGREIAMP